MLVKPHLKPRQVLHTIYNELKKGSSDSRHPFRYLSLATFDEKDRESGIRMVVLREVLKDDSIIAYTDSRTDKVEELTALNQAALLFWHDRHKVQVTVKAKVMLHRKDDVAETYWKKDVHGPARKAYTPLMAPGTPIDNPAEAHHWPEKYTGEYFCVLMFKPYDIQILQLNGKEHFRLQFKREEEEAWNGGWIAP